MHCCVCNMFGVCNFVVFVFVLCVCSLFKCVGSLEFGFVCVICLVCVYNLLCASVQFCFCVCVICFLCVCVRV